MATTQDPLIRAIRRVRSSQELTTFQEQCANTFMDGWNDVVNARASWSSMVQHQADYIPSMYDMWLERGSRAVLRFILESTKFEVLMCLVVIANSLTLGLEQSYRLEGRDMQVFERLEIAFVHIYAVEILLHFLAWGCSSLRSNWLRFDLFLVAASIFSNIVMPNLSKISGQRLGSLALLRTLRLLRLARAVRLVVKMREIRMLAVGLAHSLNKMVPTLALGFMLLYTGGCVAVELVPLAMRDDPELSPEASVLINEHFKSLPETMLTLVQFLTFDNAVLIYKPLINEDGSLAILFILMLLILGVIFMNLITATMVSRGLEQAMEDKIMSRAVHEAKRKGLILDLEHHFNQADTDRSGTLSREEVEKIAEEKAGLLQSFGIDCLLSYFDCLDVDAKGEIGIEDFCHGLEGIVLAQIPLEVKHVERVVDIISQTLKDSAHVQRRICRAVERIAEKVDVLVSDSALSTTAPRSSCGSSPPVLCVHSDDPTEPPFESIFDSSPPSPVASPLLDAECWVAKLTAELQELRETCVLQARCSLDEACDGLLARMADACHFGSEGRCLSCGSTSLRNSDANRRVSWRRTLQTPPEKAVSPATPATACPPSWKASSGNSLAPPVLLGNAPASGGVRRMNL